MPQPKLLLDYPRIVDRIQLRNENIFSHSYFSAQKWVYSVIVGGRIFHHALIQAGQKSKAVALRMQAPSNWFRFVFSFKSAVAGGTFAIIVC